MSVARRFLLIGVALAVLGLVMVGTAAFNAREWDTPLSENTRRVTALTNSLEVEGERRAGRSVPNAMTATMERSARESRMTGDERYQATRHAAYAVTGIGALFALVGFALLGSPVRGRDEQSTEQ